MNGAKFYGSTLVAYAFGHVFADCRDRSGAYCGDCRTCRAYDEGLTPGRNEALESYLDNADSVADQFYRLEEEVESLTVSLFV